MEYHLPLTLQTILSGLLREREVSGWKVLSEKQLTLHIRFCDLPSHIEANSNTSPDKAAGHSSVSYRKKPPSCVERDRDRLTRWAESRHVNKGEYCDKRDDDILCYSTPLATTNINTRIDSGIEENILDLDSAKLNVITFCGEEQQVTSQSSGMGVKSIDGNLLRDTEYNSCDKGTVTETQMSDTCIKQVSTFCTPYDIATYDIRHAETQTSYACKSKNIQELTYKMQDEFTQAPICKQSRGTSSDVVECSDIAVGPLKSSSDCQTDIYNHMGVQTVIIHEVKSTSCSDLYKIQSQATQFEPICADKATCTTSSRRSIGTSMSQDDATDRPTGYRGGRSNNRRGNFPSPYHGWGHRRNHSYKPP